MADTNTALAKSSSAKLKLLERDIALKEKSIQLQQSSVALAACAVKPDGLSEMGKRILEMQQMLLLKALEKQVESEKDDSNV